MTAIEKIAPVLSKDIRKAWMAPVLQVLDLNQAAGATVGPLCDKFGSISATQGNDSCTVTPKP